MSAAIPESGPLAAFLRYGCPGLGAGIALVLFLSPLPTCLRVAKRGYLGDVNALPFVMMLANCAAWMFYGALITDFFVYAANIPGVLGGLFYTLTCFRFSKAAAQNAMTAIALGASALFCVVGAADMAVLSPSASKTLWGSTAVAVLGVYYAAPLATLAKVVRERSSSSLHWPLCLMNAVNGSLWFAYGLALRDMFICVPNGVGAFFNLVCLAFCVAFPRKEVVAGAGAASATAGGAAAKADAPVVPDMVGGNWGGLRIQSVRFPAAPLAGIGGGGQSPSPSPSPTRPPSAGAAGAGAGAMGSGGSFLDLTQMKWRSGKSFLSLGSAKEGGGGGARTAGAGGSAAGAAAAAAAGPPAAASGNGSRIALIARPEGGAAPAANDDGDEENVFAPPGDVRNRTIRESGEQ